MSVAREPFEALGAAVACVADGRVAWTTSAWDRALPAPGALSATPWEALADVLGEDAPGDAEGGRPRRRALADGTSVEVVRATLDGGARLIELRPAPCADDALHDYLHARDDLFSTSRRLGVSEMATTLAHEINQPIGTIANVLRGVSLRLARPEPDLEAVRGALDAATSQARHAASVVARIRDFAQARRPRRERLDVVGAVRGATSLLDWLLASEGCALRIDAPHAAVEVEGDPTMLRQVFVNLVRNGVEAMRAVPRGERTLSVAVRVEAGRVRVSVADSGPGLGIGTDSLFVPFVSTKADGTGVGLNICRSFVELHQGRLWLSPDGAGATDGTDGPGGCTAHVELPLAAAPTDEALAADASPAPVPAAAR